MRIKDNEMSKLSGFLTTTLLLIVIIQMAPNLVKNLKDIYDDAFELKAKVGVLKINDEISQIGSYIKNLRNFFEKDDIKAILLRIDCPGGASGSSQALYNEILELKKEYPKPIITLTNDLCASGGYYIACATDYIIASPASIIGSIGSYMSSFKAKELIENWKIKYNIAQAGKYKTAFNPFTENSKEVNDLMQSVANDVYIQFINDVATRRKLSIDQSNKWANGKFFTGKQALELGLIDENGSETNAIRKIKELAMIEKEKKIDWVKAKKQSKLSKLFNTDEDTEDSKSQISLIDELVDKICTKVGLNDSTIKI